MQRVAAGLTHTRCEARAPAETFLPFACHCEPVRTLAWQSASLRDGLPNFCGSGESVKRCEFALGATFCNAVLQGERIATSLRSSQ